MPDVGDVPGRVRFFDTTLRDGEQAPGIALSGPEKLEIAEQLARLGVERADVADRPLTQSPISDQPYGGVLVFRDPDNIQLEFFCPPGT